MILSYSFIIVFVLGLILIGFCGWIAVDVLLDHPDRLPRSSSEDNTRICLLIISFAALGVLWGGAIAYLAMWVHLLS